ncbi:MAG: 4'-phosphopantetheinyl transferase superfamily protein [Bacteroidetes bacterium]|nr:4'-phosphopantetheinyl transferase superfamily protein [Bacteroidota bacterium]MDA1119626.1 4'-phosphopantetheinyl transferase superfamily protein [Bacteroidota bacterium]
MQQLTDDIVHVWEVDLNVDPAFLKTCSRTLSPDELERANKYAFEKDHNYFIARRGVLRKLIGHYLNAKPDSIYFNYGPFGKPYLPKYHDFQFNLAHSNGHALMAFSIKIPLGIDLEFINRNLEFDNIADHFFSRGETKSLKNVSTEQKAISFYNCWTRKEAFIKARGDGLTFPLDKFEVSIEPNDQKALIGLYHDSENAGDWTIKSLEVEGDFAAALAFKDKNISVNSNVWE